MHGIIDTNFMQNNNTIQKLAYTKQEASSLLSISVRTIDNLIAQNELTVRRIGRRVIIPATSIAALLRCDSRTMAKAA